MTVICVWPIPRAAINVLAGLSFLLVGGCTTSGAEDRDYTEIEATEHLRLLLNRDFEDGRPMVRVTVTNLTTRPICIRADALQNPYSHEMDLRMRDAQGRIVRYRDPGFIPPPLTGVVRVEPHASSSGRTYLDARFNLAQGWSPFPAGLRLQAAVRFGYCDDTTSFWARSTWQPI